MRWLVLGLAGLAMAGAWEPALAGPETADGWTILCSGAGAGRRCTATRVQSFPDNRGGERSVTVSLVRDAGCVTFGAVFDQPIDLDAPVWLVVDGGARQEFYTGAALLGLSHALDTGNRTVADGPADFSRFLAQVADGALALPDPGSELIARFAALKESRRIAVACAPMERLLPRLRTGTAVHLEFHAMPRTTAQPYHWGALTRRGVDVPLAGVVERLDHSFQGS